MMTVVSDTFFYELFNSLKLFWDVLLEGLSLRPIPMEDSLLLIGCVVFLAR